MHPPLYHELRDTIEVALVDAGIPVRDATSMSNLAANAVMNRYRGCNLYFAYGLPEEREAKKRAIRQAHAQGKSITALATEFRYTESWIRRIVSTPAAEGGGQGTPGGNHGAGAKIPGFR